MVPMLMGSAAGGGSRPQDVFAATPYMGNGSNLAVTTGIDLTGGGLLWLKNRNTASGHGLVSALRGATKFLQSNATSQEASYGSGQGVISLGISGFQLGPNWNGENGSGNNEISWSFKKAAKFYTEFVYTGDGNPGRQVAHDLGIKPGMMAIKRLDDVADWAVYHRSITANQFLLLNSTQAASSSTGPFNNTEPTTNNFTVGTYGGTNLAGATYLARLWAHDPDTTNGIIQCGSYTTDVNGVGSATLPWQPQYAIFKATKSASSWYIQDAPRSYQTLLANTNSVEAGPTITFTSNGFSDPGNIAANDVISFLAIRSPV